MFGQLPKASSNPAHICIRSRQATSQCQKTVEGLLIQYQGIIFFATHKDLWGPFTARAGRTISLGLGVTSFMFFFTYVPQMAIMAFTSGPIAAISAAVLVLSESATLTNIFSRSFLCEDALIDTFDGTLIARQQESLVAQGRQVKPQSAGRDAVARLGKLFSKPFSKFKPQVLLRSLLTPEYDSRCRNRAVHSRPGQKGWPGATCTVFPA